MLTAAHLREIADYDPETGVMTAKVRRSPTSGVGDVIGTLHHTGYLVAGVGGKQYSVHRLAWLWMTGEWPQGDLDHKNLDKADNRFGNLRPATDVQNSANKRVSPLNRTGLKGVTYLASRNKYRASIRRNGKREFLGHFATAEEAHRVYAAELRKTHGDFARVA